MTKKSQKKEMILQQDQSDCGVACLLTILQHYEGCDTLENLRGLSGTSITGTTLLGLYHAAQQTGFDAAGCQADIPALINHHEPCILHITTANKQQHYVVCFGNFQKNGVTYFTIGDPAKGISNMTTEELDQYWQSKNCLTLRPNTNFKKRNAKSKEKKQWIFQLVKEDTQLLGIALTLGLCIAALGVVMSMFSQKLIDEILPKRNFSRLYTGITLVFLLLLAREGFLYLRQFFLLKQARNFNSRIIHFFFYHLLHLPKSFFDSRKTGEFTARLNDTTRIQRVISQLAGNVIIDTLILITSTAFVFSYSWRAAIAVICFIPVLFFIVYRKNKPITAAQRSVMATYAQTEANYISTLQGIEPIKNHNKQEVYEASNTMVYGNFQDAIFKLGKIQIGLSFLANSCGVLFIVSILSYTSYLVMTGLLKPGELMAILGLCSSIIPSIGNLALITIPISEARIAFDRMFEFTSIRQEKMGKSDSIKQIHSITLQNLSFRFPGRRLLLTDISFEMKKGEITAIMGENGCGKSTLTGILLQNYPADMGGVLINNHLLLSEINTGNWRRACAVVPQQIHIFEGTVLENIAFDKATTHTNEVIQFLQDTGIITFLETLPQSVFTLLGEAGINLSGGQKQMIALARALYHQPQFLVLDEATSAMDRESERFVLNLLQKLKKDMAILLITHRLHLLKSYCNNIYIMANGCIKTYGTHEELMQSSNLYSQYWSDLVA